MPFVLEGIVTTTNLDDSIHLAPMGPIVSPEMDQITLRPYPTSHTYQNLTRLGEGVFHLTDDVLLLARAALGAASIPTNRGAEVVCGYLLTGVCQAYEFRIISIDNRNQRVNMVAEVVKVHRLRDFIGFNRAKHAVLEAAILATRFDFLSLDAIAEEFARLRVIVEKTGGPAEYEAIDFLDSRLAERRGRE